MIKYIFKSSGHYIGFITDEVFFSRDGLYLGWVEGSFLWDAKGLFRGELKNIEGNYYILKNLYALPPLPKKPSNPVPIISIPDPPKNIMPIILDKNYLGWVDGFE